MDTPSTSETTESGQARQKRVLPSRSRRGGPGVGNCDVDQMILDTQKRKVESKPVVPGDTPFLILTAADMIPGDTPASNGPTNLNFHSNDRYFDRPDVLKAYREQQIIQTPEFVNISETPSVGGRFRPRGSEDGVADTSDAAYEKRHRKYETFEKRQRLREKEKLKHEQYKLKERIEQLRAMDNAAFLALPASTFTPLDGPPAEDPEDNGLANLPGIHVNGAALYNEGERRRKEMLEVASELEERFRVLLPPDRIRKPGGSSNASVEPEHPPSPNKQQTSPETFEDGEFAAEMTEDQPKKQNIKLKLKAPTAPSHKTLPPAIKVASSKKARQGTIRVASSPLMQPPPAPSHKKRSAKSQAASANNRMVAVPRLIQAPDDVVSHNGTSGNPDIAVLESASSPGTAMEDESIDQLIGDTISESQPPKRSRKRTRNGELIQTSSARGTSAGRTDSIPPIESLSHSGVRRNYHARNASAGPSVQAPGVLLTTAKRYANTRNPRKTHRSTTAFGVKVPYDVGDELLYELPAFIREQPEYREREAMYPPEPMLGPPRIGGVPRKGKKGKGKEKENGKEVDTPAPHPQETSVPPEQPALPENAMAVDSTVGDVDIPRAAPPPPPPARRINRKRSRTSTKPAKKATKKTAKAVKASKEPESELEPEPEEPMDVDPISSLSEGPPDDNDNDDL